jgi:predicted CXXCH cytochrome family protein
MPLAPLAAQAMELGPSPPVVTSVTVSPSPLPGGAQARITCAATDDRGVVQPCHITHGAAGATLTKQAANANLCLGCHTTRTPTYIDSWTSTDQAGPGTSGSSHPWSNSAVSATYRAQLPANSTLQLGMRAPALSDLRCSACHDQLTQAPTLIDPLASQNPGTAGRHFRQISNTGDAMCVDCHAPWKIASAVNGTWTGSNLSHRGNPRAGNGLLLRRENDARACLGCHFVETHDSANTGSKRSAWGQSFGCRTCHQPLQRNDIYLFDPTLATPSSGTVAVDFRTMVNGEATNGLVNGTGAPSAGNGPCEACRPTRGTGARSPARPARSLRAVPR